MPVLPQRSLNDEIQYWIKYIDCTLKHQHPLPSGKHVYNVDIDTSAEIKALYHCLYKLYTEESRSVSFREPVNAPLLGVVNYYDVVSTPMSLRNVLDNIATPNYYTSASDVMRDVELIWQNCATYNGAASPLTAEAKKCAAALEKLKSSYADEQMAPADDVNSVAESIEANGDEGMLEELMDYFRREDPSMVEQRDLDLSRLKVKHVRAMRAIVQRYLAKRS